MDSDPSFDPSTEVQLGNVPHTSSQGVADRLRRAGLAAVEAALTSPETRVRWATNIARRLRANGDKVTFLARDETEVGLARLSGELEKPPPASSSKPLLRAKAAIWTPAGRPAARTDATSWPMTPKPKESC
jgi:hypothetical protein